MIQYYLAMNNKKTFTLFFILLCFCIALFLLKFLWFFSDTESDKIYKQGMEFYKKQDYQNAYYNFKKISFLSSYSFPALYRQATCAWELKDNKTAARKYSKFVRIYKYTDVAPEAIWKLALIELNRGHKNKALSYLNKLVDKYPDSDFAKAAAYQLGVIYSDEGKKKKAKEYFIEYIEYAPLGRYSIDVLNLLQEYNLSSLTDTDKFYIANAFYENGRYGRSLDILSEIPYETAWFLTAKNYDKLSDMDSFSRVVLKGVSVKPDKQVCDEKELLEMMALYIKKSGLNPKQAAYNLAVSSKGSLNYPLALFLLSKYIDFDSAIKNYEKIYTKYPKSIVAPDALWNVFWHYYKKEDYENALRLSKLYTNVYLDYNIQPKIMFWTAKIHMKAKKKKLAKSILHNISNNFPNSYYAFRANAILKNSKQPWHAKTDIKVKKNSSFRKFPLEKDTKEYRLLNKFAALDDFEAIQNFKINDPFLNSWLAAKGGRKSYSVLLARDAALADNFEISFSNPKYKLAYPIYFSDYINFYSKEYDAAPYLMLALMREESFFNSEAVSSTGAMGLMQVMPATAKVVDSALYDKNKLYKPEYNIMIGIKYFSHLMDIFNGNEALCVLAYNSGPGSVKKWLSQNKNKDFDEFIENVPYPETANYIKKVYTSYWVYMNIY